jgi:hypothetical protein
MRVSQQSIKKRAFGLLSDSLYQKNDNITCIRVNENNTLGAKQASKKTLKNPLSMAAKGRFEEALLMRAPQKKSTLAELLATASRMQTDLFTRHFTCVTRHVTRL